MKKEIIKSIEEVDGEYGGFLVVTSEQEISLLISNYQSCCESYGWMQSEDKLTKFIGAELLGLHSTDILLASMELVVKADRVEVDEAIFITLETNKGPLQFAVYNEHNGYYGHNVIITGKGIAEKTGL